VGGAVRVLPDGPENLEEGRDTWEGERHLMETCHPENRVDVSQGGGSGPTPGSSRRARRAIGNSERRQDNLIKKMEQIMRNNPTCPMINIVRTTPWLEDSELMMLRDDEKIVKSLVDAWQSLVCSWTIHDFYHFYTQADCKPRFHAGHMPIADYYYSIEDSINVVMELLRYQFRDNYEEMKEFVRNLFNVCERKVPKLNSFLIHSPPSGGKNYFIDAVMDFYWNRGQLGNPNRFNQFAFMEATNKRLILWNEPNYEQSCTDQLKMILGGDANTVRVKNKQDSAVYRTPVIILTNTNVNFMCDPAFKDRLVQYRWQAAPLLKNYLQKPNPMMWYELCKSFEIITEINIENF
jgi:hypothetical protein